MDLDRIGEQPDPADSGITGGSLLSLLKNGEQLNVWQMTQFSRGREREREREFTFEPDLRGLPIVNA